MSKEVFFKEAPITYVNKGVQEQAVTRFIGESTDYILRKDSL